MASIEQPKNADQPASGSAAEGATSSEAAGEPLWTKAIEELSPDEIQTLREGAAERDELFERLQRVSANFQNAQKRVKQEFETRLEYAIQDFARELLMAVDSFERAIQSARESRDFGRFLEGIQLVEKQIRDVLSSHGITAIEAEGKKFDPDLHEAMSVVETEDHPDSTVVTVLERGYRLNDRLVRPARVVVARRPEPPKGTESADRPLPLDTSE